MCTNEGTGPLNSKSIISKSKVKSRFYCIFTVIIINCEGTRNNFLVELLLCVCVCVDPRTFFNDTHQAIVTRYQRGHQWSKCQCRSRWDVYSPSRVTEYRMSNNDRKRIHALSRCPVPRAPLYYDPWETGPEGMALSRGRKREILLVKYESLLWSSLLPPTGKECILKKKRQKL